MLGTGRMRVHCTCRSSTLGRSNALHVTQRGVEWRSVTVSGAITASGRHPRRSAQFTDRTLEITAHKVTSLSHTAIHHSYIQIMNGKRERQ